MGLSTAEGPVGPDGPTSPAPNVTSGSASRTSAPSFPGFGHRWHYWPGGVALDALDAGLSAAMEPTLATILVRSACLRVDRMGALGSAERSIRHGDPVPCVGIGAIITFGVVTVAALILLSL